MCLFVFLLLWIYLSSAWDFLRLFPGFLLWYLWIPIIGGKELDLHRLFVEVTSRGGIEKRVGVLQIRALPKAVIAVIAVAAHQGFSLQIYFHSFWLRTKQAAHRLKILFGLAGFEGTELHGNLTQVQLLDALELFKKQQVYFLISTDVAARDWMEKTIVLALATGQKRFSVTLCKFVEKYAEILASQGQLTMALEYVKLLGFEELTHELVILRDRISLSTESGFGIVEIIFSQIKDFDQLWWLSIVASVMSFTYSTIGLGLGVAQITANGKIGGSLTGIIIGTVTQTQKVWRSFQALGDIAFAYSYSIILIEIQDTLKSPPSEAKTMKKATLVSVSVTTLFYMLCGAAGYAAFGDMAPGNLLTGFGFYNPYWLLDIANAAIVIHLVGAYQVYCQPLFAFVEKYAAEKSPDSEFITKDIDVPIPGFRPYKLNLFRLVWRTAFVITTTVISMLLPFFNDVVGFLGALGFWPLTVYYPVEMYIAQKKIPKWSSRWLCLQTLSFACLMISIAAAAGSVAGVVLDLKSYKPFKTSF